jgi:acyl transferase domain-containing protein
LAADGIGVLVQVGPGDLPHKGHKGLVEEPLLRLRSLSAGQSQGSDLRALIETLGHLYAAGVPVDWSAFHAGRRPRRTPLPSYAFEPRRHWFAHPSPAEPQRHNDDAAADRDAGEAAAPPNVSHRSRPDFGDTYVPPRNDVEQTLVALCEALLRIDGIGMHDNIVDLGVDSLLTMQLSQEIAKVFDVSISPHHLFAEPNLASLASKIQQLGPRSAQVRDRAQEKPKVRPTPDRKTAEEYERILNLVEGLSDAEVDEALRRLAD